MEPCHRLDGGNQFYALLFVCKRGSHPPMGARSVSAMHIYTYSGGFEDKYKPCS